MGWGYSRLESGVLYDKKIVKLKRYIYSIEWLLDLLCIWDKVLTSHKYSLYVQKMNIVEEMKMFRCRGHSRRDKIEDDLNGEKDAEIKTKRIRTCKKEAHMN